MAKRYIKTYVVLFVQIFAIIAIQAATTFNNIGLTNDNPGKISQSKDDNTQPSDEKTLDRLNKEETVSLFTGDIAFPVSLISLPGKNGLDLTVSMKYSNTDVDRISVTSNLKTPTGILGLGWSLGYDRIVINNNSTNDSEDDVYYLYSGNGMSKLIPVETTEENGIKTVHFVLKDDIYTKVTYTESEEIWMLTDSNGISKTFGGLAATNALNEPLNSVQWGVSWGNSIWVNSSNEITNQRRYPIAWNVSYVTNRYNDRIEYSYSQDIEQVNVGGLAYTKACYLSKIIDSYAHVIDFEYLDKELYEFVDPYPCAQEPDAYQEMFETKYLHRINAYSMNNLISSVAFAYTGDSSQSMTNYTYKRKLQSVIFLNQNEEELERYKFEYSISNSSLGSLTKITLPSGGSIQYELEKSDIEMKLDVSRSDFANTDVGLSPADFRDEYGNLIPIDSDYKWVPQVYYGEDYAVIIWAQIQEYHPLPSETALRCPHIRLYAFQWDGRWFPSGLIYKHYNTAYPLSSFDPDLKLHYATNQKVYDLRIPITMQRDFFALTIPRSGNKTFCIVTKTNRRNSQFAEWNLYIPDNLEDSTYRIGSLISGSNYVIVFSTGDAFTQQRIFRYDYNEYSKLWNDNLPISGPTTWPNDYPEFEYRDFGFGGNNWYWTRLKTGNMFQSYIVRKDRFKRWLNRKSLTYNIISSPIASSKDLIIGTEYSSPDYLYRYRGLGEQNATNHSFTVRNYDPDTIDEIIGAGGRAIINGETVCHVNSRSTEATTMFDDIPLYNRLYRFNGDHWTRFEASVDNANSYDARGNFAQSCSDVASVSYLKVRVDPNTPFWTLIGLDYIQTISRVWNTIFNPNNSLDYSDFLYSNNRCYSYNANSDSWNELFANTDKWGTFSRLPLCSNNIVGWYTSVDSVGVNWSGHSSNWFNASRYQLAFRNSLPNSTTMWSENSINEANVSDMVVFDDYYIMNIHSLDNATKTPSIYLRNRDLSWPSTPQAIPNTNPNLSLEVVDSFCSSDAFALFANPDSESTKELHLYKILNNQYVGKINDLRVSSVSFNEGTGLVSRVYLHYSGGNCSPSGNTALYYKAEEIPETDPTFISLKRNGSTTNYYFNGLTAWDLNDVYGIVESQDTNTPFGDEDHINNYLTDLTGISFRKESYRANEVQPFNSETGLFKVIDRDVFKESCRTVQKTSSISYKDGIETIISYRYSDAIGGTVILSNVNTSPLSLPLPNGYHTDGANSEEHIIANLEGLKLRVYRYRTIFHDGDNIPTKQWTVKRIVMKEENPGVYSFDWEDNNWGQTSPYFTTPFTATPNQSVSTDYGRIFITLNEGTDDQFTIHYTSYLNQPITQLVEQSHRIHLNNGYEYEEMTRYTYAWEIYDDMRNLNILTPIVRQDIISRNTTLPSSPETTIQSNVTTWKDWGNGKWDLYKTYSWNGTGTGNFTSNWWNNQSEPTYADGWRKEREIIARDAYGNILEEVGKDGIHVANQYTYWHPIENSNLVNYTLEGQIVNSTHNEAYICGFEGDNTEWGYLDSATNQKITSQESFTGNKSVEIDAFAHWNPNDPNNESGSSYLAYHHLYSPNIDQNGVYLLSAWVKAYEIPSYSEGDYIGVRLKAKVGNTWHYSLINKLTTQDLGKWTKLECTLDLSEIEGNVDILEAMLVNYTADYSVNNTDPYPSVPAYPAYFDEVRFLPIDSVCKTSVTDPVYLQSTSECDDNGNLTRMTYDVFRRPELVYRDDDRVCTEIKGFAYFQSVSSTPSRTYNDEKPNQQTQFYSRTGLVDNFDYNETEFALSWGNSSGSWSNNDGVLSIPQSSGVKYIAKSLPQVGIIGYQWNILEFSGNETGFSLYSLATNPSSSANGYKLKVTSNSVSLIYSNHQGGQVLTTQSISPETIIGQWSVLYDKQTLSAYHNGLKMLSFNLPTNQQLSSGEYCSFYTNNASVLIDNFVVYQSPTITASFSDGINRQIQTQKLENNEINVSAQFYDDIGRPIVQTKAVKYENCIEDDFITYMDDFAAYNPVTGLTGDIIAEFPLDNNYPYTRTKYEQAPTTRKKEIGLPGQQYAIHGNTPHTANIQYGLVPSQYLSGIGMTGFQYYSFPNFTGTLETDPQGIKTFRVYDVLGREVMTVTDAVDTGKKHTTENIYNEKGLITHKRLPNYYNPPLNSYPSNWVVSFTYDHYGNLLSKTSPDYGTVEYRYDIADRLISKKDAVSAQSNKIVYYQYDNVNRLIETGTIQGMLRDGQMVYEDNQKTWLQRNSYDGLGTQCGLRNALYEIQTRNSTNLATVIERYKYDRYGNITEKAVSSSSFDPNTYYATKYTYDPAGNVTRIEYPQCDYPNQLIITNYLPHDYFALTSISNGTDDKPAEITILPGQDITFKAQESITLLPGFTVKEGAIFKTEIGVVSTRPIEYVTYCYDNDKRIKTIGTVTNPNRYAEYTYGDNDELIQERINNRNNTYFDINYSYNSPLWPLSIASDLYLEELNYTGNYNGNVSSICHTAFDYPQNSYLYNFQWDTAGRLISANNPADLTGTNYNYTAIEYDANGNIMTSERSTASQFRSYNYSYLPGTNKVNQVSYVYGSNRQGANQITTHNSYVYDANGSVLSSSKLNKTLLMDYDIRSNLVSSIAVNNQYIIDYDYDSSGERVYSGMGSSSKIYINSITSNPLTIIDSNDNVTHYIYGPKGIVAKRNDSLTYYMLKDHLGSTRVVMNENNQAISSYDYDAWGNPMNSTVSEESAYRYTGREYDEETGLHNFRARLYDSTLMRFYQVDPAEQFASPYVYCCNSPIGLVDPDGKLVYQAIRPVYYFGVMTPFKHQFLINIPDNPSDFARFGQRTNIYGKIGFTVGATKSDDGHLAMKYNEQTDLLYARRYLQNVSSSLKEKVIKPIGHKGTDTEFIITIVHKANNYAMNTEDKPIEYPSTVQQFSKPNSNSWIQSLLRSIIGSKFQTDMDPKGDIGCDREIDPELFEEPTE